MSNVIPAYGPPYLIGPAYRQPPITETPMPTSCTTGIPGGCTYPSDNPIIDNGWYAGDLKAFYRQLPHQGFGEMRPPLLMFPRLARGNFR